MVITQVILYFFPENMQVVEGLNEVLFGNSSFLVNFIIIAIMPAICEEFFFRGFVLSSFRKNKKSITAAVICSGVLFGIMHMDFIRIVPTSMLGIAFAYAVCKSNSIGVSMLMHFLNNGFALVVTYFVSNSTYFENIDTSAVEMDATLTLGVMAFYVALGGMFLFLGVELFKEKKKRIVKSVDRKSVV